MRTLWRHNNRLDNNVIKWHSLCAQRRHRLLSVQGSVKKTISYGLAKLFIFQNKAGKVGLNYCCFQKWDFEPTTWLFQHPKIGLYFNLDAQTITTRQYRIDSVCLYVYQIWCITWIYLASFLVIYFHLTKRGIMFIDISSLVELPESSVGRNRKDRKVWESLTSKVDAVVLPGTL